MRKDCLIPFLTGYIHFYPDTRDKVHQKIVVANQVTRTIDEKKEVKESEK